MSFPTHPPPPPSTPYALKLRKTAPTEVGSEGRRGPENTPSPRFSHVAPLLSPRSPKLQAGRGRSPSVISTGTGERHSQSAVLVKTPLAFAKHMFELLFSVADADRSGCIDHSEFGELLLELGMKVDHSVIRHCLAR